MVHAGIWLLRRIRSFPNPPKAPLFKLSQMSRSLPAGVSECQCTTTSAGFTATSRRVVKVIRLRHNERGRDQATRVQTITFAVAPPYSWQSVIAKGDWKGGASQRRALPIHKYIAMDMAHGDGIALRVSCLPRLSHGFHTCLSIMK